MTIRKILILISTTFLLSSCGSIQVFVPGNSTYSRRNPITITNTSDASGSLGQLQYLLQSNGYKIMSLSAAKKAINYDSNRSGSNYHSELTSTTTVNSAYVLEMQYSYYWDMFYYAYTSFSATITDLRTGEIIMTANFRGDKNIDSVLTEFVSKMNNVIR